MGTIQESLSAAVDKLESGAAAPEPAAVAVEESVSAPVDAAPEVEAATETAATTSARARDESGRFAPKTKAAPAPTTTETPATVKPAVTTATAAPQPAVATATEPAIKAPQSWKPLAREKWASIPAEVQAEVARREREVTTTLQEVAKTRKEHAEFAQTVAPYMGMIQAESSTPIQAVANLLQTAAALRTAPPAHKAQLVAQLVKQFGVPIDALDAALSGQAMPQGQAQQQYRPPEDTAKIVEQVIAKRLEAVQASRAEKELSTFADSHEFFADVREDMADLIEVASRRNVAMTPEQAYTRAIALHPEIGDVLKQRDSAKASATAQATTQRAKAAASSVKSSPAAGGNAAQPRGIREQLEAAAATLSGR